MNGVTQHGSVGTREWRYYHISAASNKSDLLIEVNQTTLTGDCDTYLRSDIYFIHRKYT